MLTSKAQSHCEMNSPGFQRFENIEGPRRIDVIIKWRNRKFFPVNSDRKIDLNLNNTLCLRRQRKKLLQSPLLRGMRDEVILPAGNAWKKAVFWPPVFSHFFARGYGGCKNRFSRPKPTLLGLHQRQQGGGADHGDGVSGPPSYLRRRRNSSATSPSSTFSPRRRTKR